MKIQKANRRDKKRYKKKNGMVIDNKSIFTITSVIIKKGNNNGKND